MYCVRWSNEAATVHADITADHRDVPASCFYCCGMGPSRLSREPALRHFHFKVCTFAAIPIFSTIFSELERGRASFQFDHFLHRLWRRQFLDTLSGRFTDPLSGVKEVFASYVRVMELAEANRVYPRTPSQRCMLHSFAQLCVWSFRQQDVRLWFDFDSEMVRRIQKNP